jgi:hypothetical protein
MYAEIPNSLVAKKSPRIEINKVYELQRFKILPAKSLYKAVDSPVMIQFTIYTQANIVRDPPSTFPSFIYRLMDFDQIPNVVGRTESFVVNKNSDIYLCLYRFVSMITDFSFCSLIFQLTCGTWIKKKMFLVSSLISSRLRKLPRQIEASSEILINNSRWVSVLLQYCPILFSRYLMHCFTHVIDTSFWQWYDSKDNSGDMAPRISL